MRSGIVLKEESVNRSVRDALEMLGFVVLSTTVRNARGGYGASKGVPDLLVSRDGWGCWMGLEIKGPKTRVSDEQKDLEARGLIVIAQSVDEALCAVQDFAAENMLPHPKFTVGGVRG